MLGSARNSQRLARANAEASVPVSEQASSNLLAPHRAAEIFSGSMYNHARSSVESLPSVLTKNRLPAQNFAVTDDET
jgi:hypothetical protein